jgi:hypothetical protein
VLLLGEGETLTLVTPLPLVLLLLLLLEVPRWLAAEPKRLGAPTRLMVDLPTTGSVVEDEIVAVAAMMGFVMY